MPTTTYAITADDKPVALDKGAGQVTINVSNTSAKPIRGGARLMPLGATRPEWLRIDGEVERNFAAHEAHQFVVRITVPPDTPSAKYSFRLNVISVQSPDEDYTEGPVVSFEIPARAPTPIPVPEKRPLPWFYIALAAILIIGGVVVALILTTGSRREALCPPGTIVAFGGTKLPPGWLLCDGQSYLRTQYPRLFNAISTNWGSADSAHFNVPDLRGYFLRGRDGGVGRDPNRAMRQPIRTGGASGDSVGSAQADALQNIAGNLGKFNAWAALQDNKDNTPTGPFYLSPSFTSEYGIRGSDNRDPWKTLTMDLSKSPGARTSLETRPINACVNYMVKY